MNMPVVLKLIGAVFCLTILPMYGFALTPDQVFDKVKDSVVVVKTLDAQGKEKAQGSGVLLPSGKIATNCHVVEGGVSYQIGRGKQFLPATVYAKDSEKDICLLDTKGLTGKPAQLGKAVSLKVGVPVYAVGAPMGLELSLSDGIVAQLRGGPPPFIQTTAAISPGSSGGGLFNGEGQLVGLTTLYIDGGQSLNFAMPVEWIGEIKPGSELAVEGRSQIEWLKRVIALEKMEDWQGLLDWCQKWTESNPEDATIWYVTGVAFHTLKRYGDAIDAHRHALRIKPEYVDAWYNLGVTYRDLKRYDEAIEAYRQALFINSEYVDVWNSLGIAYTYLKSYDNAIYAYRQGLRINPEYANAWYNLGNANSDLKRYNEAIEAHRQVLRINPEYVDAWNNLAITYALTGNRTAALDAVKELRRFDPVKADELFNIIVPR